MEMQEQQHHYDVPITKPNPDPTDATVAMLMREIHGLRELMDTKFRSHETRFEAMDKAQALFDDNLTRVPTDVDKQVSHLKALHDEKFISIATQLEDTQLLRNEKFNSVQQQFHERDTRSERESRDNKVAVDAAFAAQKEASAKQDEANQKAIDKSEKATAETLNKQADLFKSTTDALSAQILDLKDRQTRVEGHNQGGSAVWAGIAVGIGTLIGVAGVILAFVR